MTGGAPDPAADSAAIRLRGAGRVYRMGEVDVHALRDATLDVPQGDFLVIVGPSGSGKSTMLNLIGGMDRPTSGTVRCFGQDLTTATDSQLTLYRRREIGFVFQFYNLIPTLTSLENVQAVTEIADTPMDPIEALRVVGLADRAGHFPAQMSGGEQQRVSIARAISGNPRLLLCDEPTGALDLGTSRQVLSLLADLNDNYGKTVIVITHNAAIAGVGKRVAHMRDGTVVGLETNANRIPVAEVVW